MGRGGGRVRKKGVAQGRNSPFSGGGGFGGGEKVSSMAARAYHPDSSHSRHQIPSNTLICLFPSDAFLPRTYYFLHISQPAEICRTDRLGAPWRELSCDLFRAIVLSEQFMY